MQRRHFLLLSAAAIFAPTLAASEQLYVQETNDGYLNLRAGPGTQYQIIQRLYDGMRLDIVGRDGSWRRVILADGTVGWASANFMAATYGYRYYFDVQVSPTNDGYLNLRSGPGTQYQILQRLYAGQRLWIREERGNWARVELSDGRTGWAASRYFYVDR